jgi:hypothetical protein
VEKSIKSSVDNQTLHVEAITQVFNLLRNQQSELL